MGRFDRAGAWRAAVSAAIPELSMLDLEATARAYGALWYVSMYLRDFSDAKLYALAGASPVRFGDGEGARLYSAAFAHFAADLDLTADDFRERAQS